MKQFNPEHPIVKRLCKSERPLFELIEEKHRQVKLYRSRGQIIASREAMYTPGLRECFIIRGSSKMKITSTPLPKGDRRRFVIQFKLKGHFWYVSWNYGRTRIRKNARLFDGSEARGFCETWLGSRHSYIEPF